MLKTKQEFTLSVTHFKILETVNLLNELHYYPLPSGVGKILEGVEDEETLPFKDFPTFKTLISYSSKKICRYIMMLNRYHYLGKKYDPTTNELYLEITDKGVAALTKYKAKHRSPYKKKEPSKEITIVKIEN